MHVLQHDGGKDMDSPIAVLFIHGVEVRDPRYANAAISRLRREFGTHADDREDADRPLVIEAAYWIPADADQDRRRLPRTFESSTTPFYPFLAPLVSTS